MTIDKGTDTPSPVAEIVERHEPVTWQWRYWYSSGEPGIWLSERRDDADDLLESGVLIREEKRPLYAATAILTLQGEIEEAREAMKKARDLLRKEGHPGWGVAKDILGEAIAKGARE